MSKTQDAAHYGAGLVIKAAATVVTAAAKRKRKAGK